MHAGPYTYLQRWNFKMNTVHDDGPFIPEADARARYEAHDNWFSVLPDLPGLGDGTVIPPFVIEVAVAAPEFKVHFLHPTGATRRTSFFKNIDGRLFASSVTDYLYEGEPEKLAHTAMVTGLFEPDGAGTAIFRNSRTREQEVREFRDVPVEDRWLDVPAFGAWEPLLADDDGEAAPA